jgi:hypothetical protein
MQLPSLRNGAALHGLTNTSILEIGKSLERRELVGPNGMMKWPLGIAAERQARQ